MKKKIYSIIVSGTLLLVPALFFVACETNDTSYNDQVEEDCHDDGELYCEYNDEAEGCCEEETPWYDGQGTCYSSQSYCRASGWPCVRCY